MKGCYGKELVLDIHECNVERFTRKHIRNFFKELCELIDMQRADLHWWDYHGLPEEYKKAPAHLKGISAIQFIQTSNITIHTLDDLEKIYINIFSCKDYDTDVAGEFAEKWFGGEIISSTVVKRNLTHKVEIKQQKGYNFLWINDYLWMWDVPVERKIQRKIADEAHGNVLVAGYGLGLVQKFMLENKNVKSITTVEKIESVIKENEKVYGETYGSIIIDDFFKLNVDTQYDCVIGDICDEIDAEYLPQYKKFKEKAEQFLTPTGRVLGWGQDYFEYLLQKETV